MFWGTVSLQFVPWSVLAARTIQAGQLPLWNPLVGMGAPLLANYQSGLLYPPNWLVILAAGLWGAGWAAWAQTVLVTIHLVWAGMGMYLLARRIGLSPLGQLVCGFSFALSGYLVSRSGFISINATVAWAPWMLLSVTWLATGKTTLSKIILSGIVTSILLIAGHAQTAWYIILFSVAWSTVIAWQDSTLNSPPAESAPVPSRKSSLRHVFAKLVALLISLGIGVCLAAVQLLPTAELLSQSQRARAVDFEYAMTYSFWPWRFLTLLAPGLFGSPVSGDYWGYGNYWEDALYIGVFPLILAVSAIAGTLVGFLRKKKSAAEPPGRIYLIQQNRLVLFFIFVIIASFLLALGRNTPIFPFLYFNVPSFAIFQAPTRFSLWAIISLILLAGMGADRLIRPEGRALYWTRLGTAGAGAITLGAGLTWYFLGDISPTFLRATALFGLFALTSGLLILSSPIQQESGDHQDQKRQVWAWGLLIIIGLDLLIASWNLTPGVERDLYDLRSQSADSLSAMIGDQRIYLSPADEYQLKFNRFMRFDSYSINEKWSNLREVLLPNINILDGVASANNFDPLVTARYARWMDGLGKLEAAGDRLSYDHLLNLMGVGAVEYLSHDSGLGVGYEPVENSTRIRWVPCAQVVHDGDQVWELLNHGQIDVDRVVILEDGGANPPTNCSAGEAKAFVAIVDNSPNQVKMQVHAPASGWLVFSDQWYPGWMAEIDGQPAPIWRANYLFRAVSLPAGEHQVIWKYSPKSFWVGLLISVISWIFVGIIGLLLIRRICRNRLPSQAG